jgi:hypothetical protein
LITLDNTRSNKAVTWSGTPLPKDGYNWATLSPGSGSVGAGAKATLTVNPINPNACNLARPGGTADMTVRIQADGKTFDVTVHVIYSGIA